MAQVESRFNEIYESGRRLNNRVYELGGQTVVNQKNAPVVVHPRFVASLTRQLELALERTYADFLFYPDLGHAHLYLPQLTDSTPRELTRRPPLETLLAHDELKLLYHTGELIRFRQRVVGPLSSDPWLQWRYYSRNFLSPMNAPDNLSVLFADDVTYNTVREVKDHREYARVYFSASANGCFPITIKGRQMFFDISFD